MWSKRADRRVGLAIVRHLCDLAMAVAMFNGDVDILTKSATELSNRGGEVVYLIGGVTDT